MFQILFSVIVLVSAKPSSDDYSDATVDDSNVSASASSSDESEEDPNLNANHPIGIYTKYPDAPDDSFDASAEVSPLQDDKTKFKRDVEVNLSNATVIEEGKIVEPTKVPLRGLINSIESKLVVEAQQVNANIRTKRTAADNSTSVGNSTIDDSVDVNKNLFEGLFNFTRPLRETVEKDIKIPLNGLVKAVESTLVNSAQNLKESNESSKREASVEESTDSNDSHRINRDSDAVAVESNDKPNIQVQSLSASKIIQNLGLLSPITFKPAAAAEDVEETTSSDVDDASTTTEIPIVHRTNLTVIEESKGFSLIPGSDQKLAHVQHQEITKTIFHSNLAIFPTIPPKTINAPLPYVTTTESTIDTTVAVQSSTAAAKKTELQLKHEQILKKAEQLKEKFAEIQAEPVILSQF